MSSHNKAKRGKLSINEMILVSIYSVAEKGEKCTFEKLLEIAFYLFPSTFCFSQYPSWPDSRKLDRPLRMLRRNNLISGDPKSSFTLTKEGEKKAEEIMHLFNQKRLL